MAKAGKYPRSPNDYKHNIQVKLRWYKKHSESSMVGEENLDLLSLHDLQDIFDVYIDNAVLNCWHVKTRHARTLQRLTSHRIMVKKFIYFVEQAVYLNEATIN
ncbi:MAG: hypothetical protein QM500_19700 [Methylococcales bacterium]